MASGLLLGSKCLCGRDGGRRTNRISPGLSTIRPCTVFCYVELSERRIGYHLMVTASWKHGTSGVLTIRRCLCDFSTTYVYINRPPFYFNERTFAQSVHSSIQRIPKARSDKDHVGADSKGTKRTIELPDHCSSSRWNGASAFYN